MTPLRFMRSRRELFALYIPAQGASVGRGVVLCNPFGQEAVRAHRFYRVLGQRLAASGIDVLRFDYFGCGDSAGEDAEFDLDGAVLDTIAAVALLRREARVPDISLTGLRLGASIAWLAARQPGTDIARLAMIEPVIDGVAYLGDLERAHSRALARIFGARWRVDRALREFHQPLPSMPEALGFALGDALRRQLAEQFPGGRAWQGAAIDALLLTCRPTPFAHWPLQWGAGMLRVEVLSPEIDWATNSALNSALVPQAWIERLRAFHSQDARHA